MKTDFEIELEMKEHITKCLTNAIQKLKSVMQLLAHLKFFFAAIPLCGNKVSMTTKIVCLITNK